MSGERIYKTVDKSEWGDGPWQLEPDAVLWTDEKTGLECAILRHPEHGQLNGYVALPVGHALWGLNYDAADTQGDLDVHGGLTFSAPTLGIEHEPERPGPAWWIGFDCGHHMDVHPGMEARMREIGMPTMDEYMERMGVSNEMAEMFRPFYKPIHYVKAETESLAAQLQAVKRKRRLRLRRS